MYKEQYKFEKSTARLTIDRFRSLISNRGVGIVDSGPGLFFLCGANKSTGELSERRLAIKDLVEAQVPGSSVIIAESFFKSYLESGGKRNLYDMEVNLSKVADRIIVVLESESAFCELGAFANEHLREKMLVVNDSKFRNSPSFINTGPLDAIRESVAHDPIMFYPMAENGVEVPDDIGDVFIELAELLRSSRRATRRKFVPSKLDPSSEVAKVRTLFVHDLIHLAGPLTYKSLIDLVSLLFGPKKYDAMRETIALLKALGFIDYSESKDDISTRMDRVFLEYPSEIVSIRMDLQMIRLRNNIRS